MKPRNLLTPPEVAELQEFLDKKLDRLGISSRPEVALRLLGRIILRVLAEVAFLARLGDAIDVANGCLFLASDLSSYLTGITLDVNGGMLIH